MPKATPGIPYTIVYGDRLTTIAKQAYGDGRRWRDIWAANSTVLKSGNPNMIYPGEVITIPPDKLAAAALSAVAAAAEDDLPDLPEKEPDDFTIIIDGMEIPVMSGRVVRAADTAASGWSATVAFTENDPDLAKSLTPYAYPKASCYLGGYLVCEGYLYTVEPKLAAARTCELEGWSYAVDIIDSTSNPPYEQKNVTLEQRARHLVEPLGITVVYEAGDTKFKRATIDDTEKIFDHLAKLASQRGVLISSTTKGELLFTMAASGKPVGTVSEDIALGEAFEARFDGRQRFNIYKVLSKTPGRKRKGKKNTKVQIAKDAMVPRARMMTFRFDETEGGEMKNAAEWRRSKQLADSLTVNFPVSSWYDPNGKLWRENTIVTVKSPTLFIPDGFDFLIRTVEYEFKDTGTTATLGLVPPQVFTGEPIDEPWASDAVKKANMIERLMADLP